MNKAFLKEVDATDGRCPRCHAAGVAVGPITLQTFLAPEVRKQLTESAFFCPNERCPVVYFDPFDRVVEQSALEVGVYPKDPAAPICCCFGLTEEDVREDVAEGVVTRVKAVIAQAQTPAAHCATCAPSGQSCVAEVQRCYMRLRSGGG